MALFVLTALIISNCLTCLLSTQEIKRARNELEITPSTLTGEGYFGLYQVEDTLNLSCIFSSESTSENVVLDWILPSRTAHKFSQVINHVNSNLVNLVIKNLTENDSGDYKCRAIDTRSPWYSERSIGINVKNKKGECSEMMFQCSCGMCIHKRYTCDGLKDCHHGEDELANYCGTGNPCDNKLRCPDGRCIPYTWCCDLIREQNCTTKLKHDCCIHMEKLTHDVDSDMGFQYKQHKFYGFGFLQTTVYTTIGCALAFTGMFIVIIIVIATCRMHMRRSLVSRCPAANARAVPGTGRTSNTPGNQLNYLPFYDLDLYFNRPNCNNNDLMSINPLLVSYNINNGVHFVGRPVEPPPYCEILTSPPKEGPPPPYASQENISGQHRSVEETGEPKDGREDSESETLLDANNQISVISSSSMDGNRSCERAPLAVEEVTEEMPRLNFNVNRNSSKDSKFKSKDASLTDECRNSSQCPERSAYANVDIGDSPKNNVLRTPISGNDSQPGNSSRTTIIN